MHTRRAVAYAGGGSHELILTAKSLEGESILLAGQVEAIRAKPQPDDKKQKP